MISSSMGTAQLRDTSVYTELNGLNSIRQLGQDDSPEALRQIAIQFESIFLNMMLKEMRKGEETLFADNYLRTSEMAFHRENFDNQLGLHLASEGGMGLADALYRQLLSHYQPDAAASVTPGTGGASGMRAGVTGTVTTDIETADTETTANSADNARQTAAAAYRDASSSMALSPQVMAYE